MRGTASLVSKQAALSPQADDFKSEAGAEITHNADGSWEGVVRGKDNIRRAMDMQDGSRAIEIERGDRLRSGRPTERVVDAQGTTREFPAHLVERVADKRGWKPKA